MRREPWHGPAPLRVWARVAALGRAWDWPDWSRQSRMAEPPREQLVSLGRLRSATARSEVVVEPAAARRNEGVKRSNITRRLPSGPVGELLGPLRCPLRGKARTEGRFLFFRRSIFLRDAAAPRCVELRDEPGTGGGTRNSPRS